MTRYRIMIRNLFTGVTTARRDLKADKEKAQQEVDAINEHFSHHEAWLEEVQVEPTTHLKGLAVWSIPFACFWGIIGALVAGRVGAAAGVVIGGCAGLFLYCLFNAGEGPVAKRVEERRREERRAA